MSLVPKKFETVRTVTEVWSAYVTEITLVGFVSRHLADQVTIRPARFAVT